MVANTSSSCPNYDLKCVCKPEGRCTPVQNHHRKSREERCCYGSSSRSSNHHLLLCNQKKEIAYHTKIWDKRTEGAPSNFFLRSITHRLHHRSAAAAAAGIPNHLNAAADTAYFLSFLRRGPLEYDVCTPCWPQVHATSYLSFLSLFLSQPTGYNT